MFFTEARKYQGTLVSVKEKFLPGDFKTMGLQQMKVDVVTLDHAIESLAVHGEHARGSLFVAAGVLEHASNIAPFDY